VPQSNKSVATTACASCAQKKVICKPPADWALERGAQKAQGETPKPKTARRRSTAGASIVLSIYYANHPPVAKADILEVIRATLERDHAEFRSRLQNIETLLREVARNTDGVNLSSLTLCLPPVPLFDAPSPAISTTSAVSAASTLSAINLSRMSLGSPNVAGPSGTVADPSEPQGE
jgi:hypothetical protein